MRWLLEDPESGGLTAWWSIDPRTGEETGDAAPKGVCGCLGESVLSDVAMVASNIDATFGASRHFSDEEVRRLFLDRVVPASVQPYADATDELLQSVDDLWLLVEKHYRQAWDRSATQAERHWLCAAAFDILRPRKT